MDKASGSSGMLICRRGSFSTQEAIDRVGEFASLIMETLGQKGQAMNKIASNYGLLLYSTELVNDKI